MINNKTVLAVIPARGGSKRLPGKNIKLLKDKPLIAWTIEEAENSKYIDRVIVSTDDKEIADISRLFKADVPFLRPAALAQDTTSTVDVLVDLLSKVEKYDYLCLLQPTSPLRTSDDIDGALAYFEEKKADSVISVCVAEHSPLWSNVLPPDNSLSNFIDDKIKNKRSQDLPVYYRLNGAVYIIKTEKLLQERELLLSENCYAYVMPNERSVDIDTAMDFYLCQLYLDMK
ncbi:MAG: cytidylyltransferase domain-containing protein [bacterium]